jgi:hypothetical protein
VKCLTLMALFRFQRHYLVLVIGCIAVYSFLNSQMNHEQQSSELSTLSLLIL